MKLKAFFTFAILTVILLGCDSKLDSSGLPNKEKIMVNLLAFSDEVLSVHVSKSLPILDTSAEPIVTNAKVTITDDVGKSYNLAYDMASNRYVSTWLPQTGKTYAIKVALSNDLVTSDFYIPSANINTKATWQDNTGQDSSGFPTGTINFIIKDNGQEHNYYEIALFRYQDVTQTFEILRVKPGNPEIAANPIINKDGALILDDGGFNGQNKSLNFITPYGSAGVVDYKYLVVVKSLSQQYYQYFKSLDNYQQQNGIFSEPSAVYTNVKGGVGICAGAGIYRDTIR